MKLPLTLSALLLAATAAPLAHAAELPPALKTFLGEKPPKFQSRFLQPAKTLRKALQHSAEGKHALAAQELGPLAKANGVFTEHALFQLGLALSETKDFAQSSTHLERLLLDYPNSPYEDAANDLLLSNACERGLRDAKNKKGTAATWLERCLERTAWRGWSDREAQATALYEIYKGRKDPLFGPFVAQLIQAMPANTALRSRIVKEIPSAQLSTYDTPMRYRTRTVNPAGVKPTYPDQELFDQAMEDVLNGKWGNARSKLRDFEEKYSQSEHRDRAQYWLARTNEQIGDEDEAKKRYEAIFNESPLSYYGLQAGLRLKKDFAPYLKPSELPVEAMKGTPLPRQAMSLWRLRALLEEGLIEPARMEARSLFFYKPGGATFGQDNAAGAALAAFLFHNAGYSNAAFSHAYAAVTLDQKSLNSFVLEIIFPQVFAEAIEKASETSGVHPLLLLSVAKQESAFLPNAVSKANALGLMQLLLSTARDMTPKITREELFEPGPNTQAGGKYLARLLNRFGGNIALTLAGYNAGPTRAAQWQKRMAEAGVTNDKFDVDVFIDTIPFTETRRYVGSILRNYAWYKLLAKDGKVENLEELAFQWQKNKNEPPVTNEPPAIPESPAPPAPVVEPTAPKPPPAANTPPAAPENGTPAPVPAP